MIRALFSFVVTLGLIAAAALWAVRNVEPEDLVRAAETPVSRTVELMANELGDELAVALEPAARAVVERAEQRPALPAPAVPPVAAEVPDGDGARSEPDPVEVADADPRAEETRGAAGEPLAESAVLLRRMLGLYERTLGPQ